ncbi:lipocalin-like domain-containing protein [Sandarakinorhabdus rubra]|uniref:lipocalin-like domain-containing protein n=1 Tax=Sandarakinorhabdus rubra TaxID=2672568 RepID=UPI0013DC50CC|nr:lipocalin-like domain-containing protein [Sandarakinorhabdus rubra]
MRRLLLLLLTPLLLAADFAPVRPGVPLRFPADHGAHPEFRTEWWYITGQIDTPQGRKGFQVTFFRTKPGIAADHPSRFAPTQVIFAHAALADPARGRLLHAARIARAGFGLAEAKLGDMDVKLDDWRLWRGRDGRLHARAGDRDFALDLVFTPTQGVILQGEGGYSRKGPHAHEASHYYSWPHLAVSGRLNGKPVTGTAWLDREWSSTLLNPGAVGWDWLGLNLDGGGALTLFRVRDGKGGALWAGGSHRAADGRLTVLGREDVRWQDAGWWESPRSKARWPVRPQVEYRVGGRWQRIAVTPLMPDQELDSRAAGGPLYWEGAVTVPGGRGYLELTGYGLPLRM